MLIEIKAGQFRKVSRLVRRACCNCMDGNCLLLDDGRKIITPIFWWQTYLGFYYMPIGTKLRLFYSESSLNKIYLEKVEVIGQEQ